MGQVVKNANATPAAPGSMYSIHLPIYSQPLDDETGIRSSAAWAQKAIFLSGVEAVVLMAEQLELTVG